MVKDTNRQGNVKIGQGMVKGISQIKMLQVQAVIGGEVF